MDAPMVKVKVEEINDEIDVESQEREHFTRILNSFRSYRTFCQRRVTDTLRYYEGLPTHHKQLIPNFLQHLTHVQWCICENYDVLKLIIQDVEHIFENKQNAANAGEDEPTSKATLPKISDMDKLKSTLRQFVRDWSTDGQAERDVCYTPVIEEIIITSLAVTLHKCKEINNYTLYPWVHQWTNNLRNEDQVRAITFPDVDTSDLPENASFSMAAGNFLEVYEDPVFFIDTAHNIIAYVEKIFEILKPGGYWVNMGPLLYHYADMPNEVSIELAYEDVRSVIEKMGFVFEMEKKNIASTYTENPASMLTHTYNSVMFVCRKPVMKEEGQ
ncbi:CARME-like protein [Mya arenaria]|uniref:carnosine N-methyltransferase n=1 Tax=Mya arenaria TaxID=6604 RepID=A0ABY7DA19_MYAAR|nr:CARME-like protein [Mya arenaria]